MKSLMLSSPYGKDLRVGHCVTACVLGTTASK